MKCVVQRGMLFFVLFSSVYAIGQGKKISLTDQQNLTPVNVSIHPEKYKGKNSLRVEGVGSGDLEQLVRINKTGLSSGVIELELAGQPAKNTFADARGFVGIAFRVNQDNSKFEYIYLRPTNGRAEDQQRRNHSVQYSSFPDYPWDRLRKESPEKYESYVDLRPGEWTKISIVIKGAQAKLYVHGNKEPSLIVNDLKLGAAASGSIGLWIGPGTVAHFANLRVHP